jgi:hypothetical protein
MEDLMLQIFMSHLLAVVLGIFIVRMWQIIVEE